MFSAAGWDIRLSPTGPFLTDTDGGGHLQCGPGSLGIVLRAQGTSTAAVAITQTPEPVAGLEDIPCDLRGGLHYNVELVVALLGDVDPTNIDTLRCYVHYSEDHGATWADVPGRVNHPFVAGAGGLVWFKENRLGPHGGAVQRHGHESVGGSLRHHRQ